MRSIVRLATGRTGAILSDDETEAAWGDGSSWELAEGIRSARFILKSAGVDSGGVD